MKGKGSMTTYWVGDPLLKEETERSTFDEQPVVSFQEDQQERGKPTNVHPRSPTRVAMDGSLYGYSYPKTSPPKPVKSSTRIEPESHPVHTSRILYARSLSQ